MQSSLLQAVGAISAIAAGESESRGPAINLAAQSPGPLIVSD